MNRRGFLKGLGGALAAAVAVPLAFLLPKGPRIIYAAGGVPKRQGLTLADLRELKKTMDTFAVYGRAVIHVDNKGNVTHIPT